MADRPSGVFGASRSGRSASDTRQLVALRRAKQKKAEDAEFDEEDFLTKVFIPVAAAVVGAGLGTYAGSLAGPAATVTAPAGAVAGAGGGAAVGTGVGVGAGGASGALAATGAGTAGATAAGGAAGASAAGGAGAAVTKEVTTGLSREAAALGFTKGVEGLQYGHTAGVGAGQLIEGGIEGDPVKGALGTAQVVHGAAGVFAPTAAMQEARLARMAEILEIRRRALLRASDAGAV